jgi:hypothetical protein
MPLYFRRSVFAFVLGAALAAAVLVGRAAHATTGEINACFKPSNGTLYLLGESSGREECMPGDIPISWNTEGVNGQDGVSVTSEALAPGDDPACPNGGSKFTAADEVVTYACNGTNGADGQNGVDGQDGADFAGTFTSPNGLFKLVVDDTNARMEGPAGRVRITASGIDVDSNGVLELRGAAAVRAQAGSLFQIQSSGLFSASGSVTTIGGAPIFLNGPGCGLVRTSDVNPFIPPNVGGPVLLNPGGTTNVRTPC